MKFLSLSAAAVLAMSALPSTPVAYASTGIQRCAMPDGSMGYSDRACGAYGAQTAAIPDAMMTRLLATLPRDEPEDTSIPPSAPRRAPAAGCARTPVQLEADLRGSFALGDVNRIAESYHWVGLSNAEGQRVMNRLESLGKRPLRDTHFFSAQIASLSTADTSPRFDAGDGGTLQLQLGGPSVTAVDFDVEKYAGCYFVRF